MTSLELRRFAALLRAMGAVRAFPHGASISRFVSHGVCDVNVFLPARPESHRFSHRFRAIT